MVSKKDFIKIINDMQKILPCDLSVSKEKLKVLFNNGDIWYFKNCLKYSLTDTKKNLRAMDAKDFKNIVKMESL